MLKKNTLDKFLKHPDFDEIVAKLSISLPPKDVHEWLTAKYSNVNDLKFVISASTLKKFGDEYLDFYELVKQDLSKTSNALKTNSEDDITLALQGNVTYNNILVETAGKQFNIKETISKMCKSVEIRFAQLFDNIQSDPQNFNPKLERLFIEYTEVLGGILDKCYKFTEEPAQTVINNNSISVQIVDSHLNVITDCIKNILAELDLESSMYFMEMYHEKMQALKLPENNVISLDKQLIETKMLSATIDKKLND